MWQNIISDSVRIMAVLEPADEEKIHIYLKFYQILRQTELSGESIHRFLFCPEGQMDGNINLIFNMNFCIFIVLP